MKRLRQLILRNGRFVASVGSIFLIVYGGAHVVLCRLTYNNYWGGMVFAPFTLVIGVICLYAAVVRFGRPPSAGSCRREKNTVSPSRR